MKVSPEDYILAQSNPANSGIVAPAPQQEVSPSINCRLPGHDKKSCVLCARHDYDAAKAALAVTEASITKPVAASVAPAPIATPPKTEPPSDPSSPSAILLRAAGDLASAIDRCSKLSSRIAGLELSLESAKVERDAAEAAKDVAQDALRKLVVTEEQ